MGIFSSIFKKEEDKKPESAVMPVLPTEIYKAATLELQDVTKDTAKEGLYKCIANRQALTELQNSDLVYQYEQHIKSL